MAGIDDTRPLVEARGPVRRSERALTPDLARGTMLLFIALANAANFAFASQPGIEQTPDGLERILNLLMLTLVDSRAYPVFAFMFGYGLVQLARRQESAGAGPRTVRAVLLRRNAWLVVLGFLHATLLYFGDFLGAYGIVGIIATLLLLPRSDRVQRIVLWIWGLQVMYVLVAAATVATRIAGGDARIQDKVNDSLTATSYPDSMLERLGEWPAHTATVVGVIVIAWLGMWAARARILEEPAEHLPLLRRVAGVSLGIAVVGGLPLALVGAGMIDVDAPTVSAMALLHAASGQFGGPGYVALIGLLAVRLTRDRTSPVTAVAVSSVSALGQRSLSGYLFQSLAWMLLLSPFTLALGDRLGSTAFTAAGCAIAVWLVSLAVAYQMSRRSYRGPAETVLRRLTYGRR